VIRNSNGSSSTISPLGNVGGGVGAGGGLNSQCRQFGMTVGCD
jgi:hypothetical protein